MRRPTCWLLVPLLLWQAPLPDSAWASSSTENLGANPVDAPPESVWQQLEKLLGEMQQGRSGHEPLQAALLLYGRAYAGYALINASLADPIRAQRATGWLDPLIKQLAAADMAAPFHTGRVRAGGVALSASVAQRGHLLLLLCGRRLLGSLAAGQQALLDDLAAGLSADLLGAPQHLLPTYGQRIFPADNEVVAAGLAIYLSLPEVGHATAAQAALQALQTRLVALEQGHLPASEVTPGKPPAVPRGCALSWSVAMRGCDDFRKPRE